MYFSYLFFAATGALFQASNAAPTPTQPNAELEDRSLINRGLLSGIIGDVFSELNSLSPSATGTAGYSQAWSALTSVTPTASPTSPQQAISTLSAMFVKPLGVTYL